MHRGDNTRVPYVMVWGLFGLDEAIGERVPCC
jgi:hypothetical protein